MKRYPLPDGRVLLVHGRIDSASWHLEVEGIRDSEIIGRPLNSALAAALGYNMSAGWPDWVDELAKKLTLEVQ